MSKFLILGALAWDRFVRLQDNIKSGARLSGVVQKDELNALVGGRLGGGGANAASALTNAGHETQVYAPVATGEEGDAVVRAAKDLGIGLRMVRRVDSPKGTTLILVEPNGERIILGLQDSQVTRTAWKQAIAAIAPLSLNELTDFAPKGAYLRSAFPGHENLAQFKDVTVVGHWPLNGLQAENICEGLIGSVDDFGKEFTPEQALLKLRKQVGERLRWLIATQGAEGGWICLENQVQRFTIIPKEQVDATGAGDTFAAGVLEAIVSGANVNEAVQHGANWGGLTVGQLGGATRMPLGSYPRWAV